MVAIIFLSNFLLNLVQQIQIVASSGYVATAGIPQAVEKVVLLSGEKVTFGLICGFIGERNKFEFPAKITFIVK